MGWLLTGIGVLLVLGVAREVFHTVFHPAGQTDLSLGVFRAVWALTGRIGPRARSLAGPSAMVLVITLWTLFLALGWALVYLPAMPAQFSGPAGVGTDAIDDVADALSFALVAQATVGFGDVTPTTGLLRILAPVQAIMGFALFTVALGWVLSIYPALHRQRASASLANAIYDSHRASGVPSRALPDAALARQIDRLTDVLTSARVDYTQYPSTFYFAAPGPSMALSDVLPFVDELAHLDGLGPEAAVAAGELRSAFDLFADALGDQHFAEDGLGDREVVQAFRRHHAVPG